MGVLVRKAEVGPRFLHLLVEQLGSGEGRSVRPHAVGGASGGRGWPWAGPEQEHVCRPPPHPAAATWHLPHAPQPRRVRSRTRAGAGPPAPCLGPRRSQLGARAAVRGPIDIRLDLEKPEAGPGGGVPA